MKTWSNRQHEAVLREKKQRKQQAEKDRKEAEMRYSARLTNVATGNKSKAPSTMIIQEGQEFYEE